MKKGNIWRYAEYDNGKVGWFRARDGKIEEGKKMKVGTKIKEKPSVEKVNKVINKVKKGRERCREGINIVTKKKKRR